MNGYFRLQNLSNFSSIFLELAYGFIDILFFTIYQKRMDEELKVIMEVERILLRELVKAMHKTTFAPNEKQL